MNSSNRIHLCRHCGAKTNLFLDLGFAPPSNSYLAAQNLQQAETWLPLVLNVCPQCFLVQTQDYTCRETFFNENYAYFSSTSKSWLNHAKNYCDEVISKFNLQLEDAFVVEIASNDGYLLKNFVAQNISCLGIEPTKSTAEFAIKQGVPTLQEFFGVELAKKLAAENKMADLIAGNNVYAHVPDINDFSAGLKILLKPKGVITLEFPHLLNLLKFKQFDTIYHEHYSYLSLFSVQKILNAVGLEIFDVKELPTHGGSLRLYICHQNENAFEISPNVAKILQDEKDFGLQDLQIYQQFAADVFNIKLQTLEFLLNAKKDNLRICAYGAAAKGNTLLNYVGIKSDIIDCVYDAAESKQNLYLPGSHVPIVSPAELVKNPPDILIIFPWNIQNEIVNLYANQPSIISKKTKFVKFIPSLEVIKN